MAHIIGTTGDDSGVNALHGTSGDDLIEGLQGRDDLYGGEGGDKMYGGAGNDIYHVDNANDQAVELAGQGKDTVFASRLYTLTDNVENLTLTGIGNAQGNGNALDNTITGNDGGNRLNGLAGNDVLLGGLGNDTLDGGKGLDVMKGGEGDDRYYLDSRTDVVREFFQQGNDTIIINGTYILGASVENLIITGTADRFGTGNNLANHITGNAGNNTLGGAEGDDTIDGGLGADTMRGGTGNDTFYVDNTGDVVTEYTGQGTDSVFSTASFTLGNNVETLTLTGTGNIDATGNSLANVLTGNAGDNVLDGGAGDDTMKGGNGNDTYRVDSLGDAISDSGGTDTVVTGLDYGLSGVPIENLTLTGTARFGSGNSLANVLTGNDSGNVLNGGYGADTLIGGLGDDIYTVDNAGDVVVEAAGAGNDQVFSSVDFSLAGTSIENLELTGHAVHATGSADNNILRGSQFDNVLDGGDGNDTLTGRLGADTFLFNINSGADTITDFSAAQNDLINVHAYTGGTVTLSDLSQAGADTRLDLGGGNVITIVNTTYNDPNLLSHIVW